MKHKKTVHVAGMDFYTKTATTQYFSGILNRAVNRDLNDAEFDQVLALFRCHREYESKTKGDSVKRIFVSNPRLENNLRHFHRKVFQFETASGHQDDFSMGKCIKELWASAKLVEEV